MKSAIIGLFGVTLAAAVLEILLPDDGSDGAKRALRLLVVLSVLLLLLTPFVGVLQNFGELAFEELAGDSEGAVREELEEVMHEAVGLGSASALKAGVKNWLKEKCGVASEEAVVNVYMASGGELKRVEIFLSGAALLKDPREIQSKLSEMLGCETEVR